MILDTTKEKDFAILSCMRGPDAGYQAPRKYGTGVGGAGLVKMLTTAVVRHRVGVTLNAGAMIVSPERAKEWWASAPPARRTEAREYWQAHQHFRLHIRRALRELDMHDYMNWLAGALDWCEEDYQ